MNAIDEAFTNLADWLDRWKAQFCSCADPRPQINRVGTTCVTCGRYSTKQQIENSGSR